MVRIGLMLSILTISLMIWAYSYTQAPGYPGDPTPGNDGLYNIMSSSNGHALAVRSDTQLTFQLNPLSNHPYWELSL
ncbi:hypothetical protein I1H34_26915 (plasmid) [Acaryochloris marina S15]|nr:hypothetical protein I1H34_26915 [Acaryochloris marina S15]